MNGMEKAVNMIWLMVGDKKPLKANDIRKAIDTAYPVVKGFFNEDESESNIKEKILRHIESRCSTWMIGPATTLDNWDDHEPWLKNKKSTIPWEFWTRYYQYITLVKGWNSDIAGNLDEITDKILERLEDPMREGSWDRRGMVVGEIQSGKTANYIGLIGKAIDSGYKLIIVLAGLHNSLRSQTQIRIDEGILGYDSQKSDSFDETTQRKMIGVGNLPNYRLLPGIIPLTTSSENGDFSRSICRRRGVVPGEYPIILVIKKNASVLKNLKEWALDLRAKDLEDGRKVVPDVPLLMIDDEADNASVNTINIFDDNGNPLEDYDVTKINGLIRKILFSFEKSAYVGYTATPFANIFIYPEGESPVYGPDLFPRSFIINLPVPTNYTGPVEIFGLDPSLESGYEEVQGLPLVEIITDYEEYIPTKHKIDLIVKDLPESLKKAIKSFILSCAARSARGQEHSHNSMLVHVTRYIQVQNQIARLIKEELKQIQQRLQYGEGSYPDHILEEMEKIWREDYIPVTEKVSGIIKDDLIEIQNWNRIKENLVSSALKIEIIIANGSAKDALNYRDHEKTGLSAIIIGGDKLSRGLTLEGLTISYYLRATRMYDTLMQMGRWFGYRSGYLDLCRIYTSSELADCYRHIALANKELRDEFDHMVDIGGTPVDYGLRVRTHPNGMIITSMSKMRSGERLRISYAGTISESIVFHSDTDKVNNNYSVFSGFISSLGTPLESQNKKNYFKWKTVPGTDIVDLLNNIETHPDSFKANSALLAQYIKARIYDKELTDWTVVLITGGQGGEWEIGGHIVTCVTRTILKSYPGKYTIRRLVSPSDEWLDFDESEQKAIMENTIAKFKRGNTKNKEAPTYPSGEIIRDTRSKKNGLLLLYPVELTDTDNKKIIKEVGFALSFPKSDLARTVEYQVNKIYWQQGIGENGY